MGKSKHSKKRSNGSGTLIKKPNGVYQARWSYEGEFHYQSTGETNYEKALAVLEKLVKPFKEDSKIAVEENLLAQIRSDKRKRDFDLEKTATIPVDEIWTRFCAADKKIQKVKARTMMTYSVHCKCLVDWLKESGITDMKKVTPNLAQKYKDYLMAKFCEDTVKQRMNFARWVWKSLAKELYIKQNPFEGEDGDIYKVSVRESGHRRLLSDEEVTRLIDVLETDEERLLFGIGIYLGQRISDCACFRKSYINFQTNEVHFSPIKTEHCKDPEVYAILCPPLRALVDKVVAKGGDDDYLMPRFASLWKRNHLSYHVRDIFRKAGIATSETIDGRRHIVTGFHALRIWFATKARNWMPESVVSKILCHRTEKMTEHYFRQNREVIERGLLKFDDLFGTGTGNAPAPTPETITAGNLVEGVTNEELKELVEVLSSRKKEGEGLVDCLRRLVGEKQETLSPMLEAFKKAS